MELSRHGGWLLKNGRSHVVCLCARNIHKVACCHAPSFSTMVHDTLILFLYPPPQNDLLTLTNPLGSSNGFPLDSRPTLDCLFQADHHHHHHHNIVSISRVDIASLWIFRFSLRTPHSRRRRRRRIIYHIISDDQTRPSRCHPIIHHHLRWR